VSQQRRDCKAHPIEQLGTYDPMENHNGEKLVSFNLERIKYWMAKKARLTNPVAELLGMSINLIAKNVVIKCISNFPNIEVPIYVVGHLENWPFCEKTRLFALG